ncbi:MAG: ferredoxin [archaeon]
MIKINKKACIGCGSCEAICPEVFKMNKGKAEVISKKDLPCVKEAAESCPVDAIKD